MSGHNIYAFGFNEMYNLYSAKVERKGRVSTELDELAKGKSIDKILRT
ncbi:MAG: hypothetical protein R3Y58_02330 [Eubacteriales bacterium]